MDGYDVKLAAAIIRNAKDYAIFTMDGTGQITSWSSGAENVFACSPHAALGKNFRDFFTEADRAAGAPGQEIASALKYGRAEDTRWHLRQDGQLFWANGVTILMDGGEGPSLLKVLRDETASRLADEQRVLLLHELNHRIKNTLATVQSIADRTLRGADVAASVRQTLANRLRAISDAHNVLVDQSWAGADMHAIVAKTLAGFDSEQTPRVIHGGPPVRLPPNQAVSISLALHELATNAVKYGALGPHGGQVHLSWNLSQNGAGQRHLNLLWKEHGGPLVQHSGRRGFGSRLLEQAFGHDQYSKANLEMAPDGVRCSIAIELVDEPQDSPDPQRLEDMGTAPPPQPPPRQ